MFFVSSHTHTGRPFGLQNCSVLNQSADSLQVECIEGFDGGLPQGFLLELVEMPALRLVRNLSLLVSNLHCFIFIFFGFFSSVFLVFCLLSRVLICRFPRNSFWCDFEDNARPQFSSVILLWFCVLASITIELKFSTLAHSLAHSIASSLSVCDYVSFEIFVS